MTSRYSDNNNGTLTDTRTGLMWQESYAYADTGNYMDWFEGKNYVARLNETWFGGHQDWRLPDKMELQSLYEMDLTFESRGRSFPLHIDPVFEFGYASCFWTWKERYSGALCFSFGQGDVRWYPKTSFSGTVRAVRLHLNPFKLIRSGEQDATK